MEAFLEDLWRDRLDHPPLTGVRTPLFSTAPCPVRGGEAGRWCDYARSLTPLPTVEGWLYLAGVKDLYTCEVVAHAMDARMTTDLVQGVPPTISWTPL
ncbi:MAG: hypothetical protein Nkreftii_001401 [Candidatus Nitrospira kreftii]|uniref:Transposase n=1 Tax=Candidatus Nitrospira kreftii TaxID=2652173 RepID=A0A7S8FD37_9BACT|nr:MAG: hypothetical protein Nkreftii_001401 [Candidatus Nitrospira kreftii]